MSDESPLSVSPVAVPVTGEPIFTIAGPSRAGLTASLLPDGFAPHASEPVFTIIGPGHEARMRALEQRCEQMQSQIAQLARG